MLPLLRLIGRSLALSAALLSAACVGPVAPPDVWTAEERKILASLQIQKLPPPPPSPGNPVADDPRAADLGQRLFFDARLSRDGTVSCAHCHAPELGFRDGLAQSRGIGVTTRRSMRLLGVAHSPWLFWDGRIDSLWAQALEPLEDPVEHGANRVDLLRHLAADPDDRPAYEALFGPLPPVADAARFPPASPRGTPQEQAAWAAMAPADQQAVNHAFANLGRALEAYQRLLQPGPAPFDAFVEDLLGGEPERAQAHLSLDQRQGLKLFIGRANCVHCHHGPRFTDDAFHNTGLDQPGALGLERGRIAAVQQLLANPFNCLGPYSGAPPEACDELRFVRTEGEPLVGAFRTVSLRNVADTGPFMHRGQLPTLEAVVAHYNEAQPTSASSDLQPLRLSPLQQQQIVAFLASLSAPPAVPVERLRPP